MRTPASVGSLSGAAGSFSRKAGPSLQMHFTARYPVEKKESPRGRRAGAPESFPAEIDMQRESGRVTLHRYAPCGVLVNGEFQVLQFRGDTSSWLKLPTGKASFNVLKMTREGLLPSLREALGESKKERQSARRENVRIEEHGHSRSQKRPMRARF